MAKSKKVEGLVEMSLDELQVRLNENVAQYQKMKFNHTITPLENPQSIKFMRREIARMNTELRRRELEVAPKGQVNEKDNG